MRVRERQERVESQFKGGVTPRKQLLTASWGLRNRPGCEDKVLHRVALTSQPAFGFIAESVVRGLFVEDSRSSMYFLSDRRGPISH